jgi:hypothetical protein
MVDARTFEVGKPPAPLSKCRKRDNHRERFNHSNIKNRCNGDKHSRDKWIALKSNINI